MEQAVHFLQESEALFDLVTELSDGQLETPTQFKQWTINDILVHLHFWNQGADLALTDPDAFTIMFEALHGALKNGNLRDHENGIIKERGHDLVAKWSELFRDMGKRWQQVDPKTRVKWAGPDMSARTSISARQMETWAHGQAIFDILGQERKDEDRIANIVMLGVNAFGWSHKVHGIDFPEIMPAITLTSPSGQQWRYGGDNGMISGTATEFCQVVTQTRNINDTSLQMKGDVATRWMQHAQCFAGPKETPPAPGIRFTVQSV